jgi:bifunctional non-homologous end joining protein LigD
MAAFAKEGFMTSAFIKPMECTKVDELPDAPEKWLYEVKLDGYRCCAVVKRGKPLLYSRYGNAWRDRYADVRESLAATRKDLVLDGEIVAVDRQGRPSFQQLQNWQSTRMPIIFFAFDLLQHGARDLRRVPIEERKALLDDIVPTLGEHVRVSAILDARLRTIIPKLKKLGLEGVVAKRRGSIYEAGRRSKTWLKKRFNELEELVIGGYLLGDEQPFARLLVGEWQGDKLVFLKKLKNGFTPQSRRQVFEAIRNLKIAKNPFANLPEPPSRSAVDEEAMKSAVWVRPVRRVEVEFIERTTGGKLRHALFRQLVE